MNVSYIIKRIYYSTSFPPENMNHAFQLAKSYKEVSFQYFLVNAKLILEQSTE